MAALGAFTEVVKVTDQTELWDAKLAWYSPSVTRFVSMAWSTSLKSMIGLVGRVFTNGPGDLGSILGRVILKILKTVLVNYLLNTQQYKVRTEGKVEQYRERSGALPYTSV